MMDRYFLITFAMVISLLVTLFVGRFVVKLIWGV